MRPPGAPRSGWVQQVAGANRRWRLQFRCRGSHRESAVAQLFSLRIIRTMNIRHTILLLSPGFMFAIIAAGAFLLSEMDFRYYDPANVQENQQKYDTFVANVKSGKWQLTSDKALEAIRLERKRTEAEAQISLQAARTIRSGGWCILLGVACQVLVVFSVVGRLKAMMPNQSPEPSAVNAGTSATRSTSKFGVGSL